MPFTTSSPMPQRSRRTDCVARVRNIEDRADFGEIRYANCWEDADILCEALRPEPANPGARLAYWNMLVPRRCPAKLADRIRPLAELSADLFARDLAFFYSNFIVEEAL